MILSNVFSPKGINLNLQSKDKDELFEEMIECLVAVQPGIDRAQVLAAIKERESKMSTGIMHGIAIPHGRCACVDGVIGAVGISRQGVDYQSLDGAPVRLVFMFVCGENEAESHLEVLKELASVLQEPSFSKSMMEKTSAEDVYQMLKSF